MFNALRRWSWITWSASGLGLTYAFRLKTGRPRLWSRGIAGAHAWTVMLAGEGIGKAAGKSFWQSDIAAICNLKCDLEKIFSRFVNTFLMRSDRSIGR